METFRTYLLVPCKCFPHRLLPPLPTPLLSPLQRIALDDGQVLELQQIVISVSHLIAQVGNS